MEPKFGEREHDQEAVIEVQERERAAQVIGDFLTQINAGGVFNDHDKRDAWVKKISYQEFKSILLRLNGLLTGTSQKDRKFSDMDPIFISAKETSYIAPTFEDREPLLLYAFEKIKTMDNIDDAGLLISMIITMIHPLPDGNGRTARLVRHIWEKGWTDTEQNRHTLAQIIGTEGRNLINTNEFNIRLTVLEQVREDVDLQTYMNGQFPERFNTYYPPNVPGINFDDASMSQIDRSFYGEIFSDHGDGVFGVIAVAKFLKNSNRLNPEYIDKYGKFDLASLAPELSKEDLQAIVKLYRDIKKRYVQKFVDIMTQPPLNDGNKTQKENIVSEIKQKLQAADTTTYGLT